MAKLKPWVQFTFDANTWAVYLVPQNHRGLYHDESDTKCLGQVWLEKQKIYILDSLTATQHRNILAHEIQHIVEEWADVDYERKCSNEDVADSRTDLVSKGWLYLIRHNPALVKLFQE